VAGADDPGLIWAAVSVIVTSSPDSVLLIRRAERPGDPWSGHMALPGGRREPADADLLETAVRETREEVGLTLDRSWLLGTLDDVVPRTPVLPPVAVRPFVFALPGRPGITPNREVAAVAWVPLDHLLDPATYHSARIDVRGTPREMPAYRLEETIVWGMTERILTGLLAQLS
jgi:8-oxo-dGTP pyrophosphatase MutT (NUDIX family)